jgi:hypothetical protein
MNEQEVETAIFEAQLRAEVASLQKMADMLRAQLDSVLDDRDAWRAHAMRPWWQRLAG